MLFRLVIPSEFISVSLFGSQVMHPLPFVRQHVRVMVIVWRLRGNIIRTDLCWIV